MLKSPCRLLRTSLRHGLRIVLPRKQYSVAATVTTESKSRLPATYRHEDHLLREIFDSPNVWRQFSQRAEYGSSNLPQGLFQNHHLIEPRGFLRYAELTRTRAQKIVKEVLSASSTEDYIALPRRLDLLSDTLCRILDPADFVRSTHPQIPYRQAATEAYGYLFEYMNLLNTTPGLKQQLEKAVSDPEISKAWEEAEKTVAQILLKDFGQSAIDLPQEKRQRFVELSNETKRLGHVFVENMAPRTSHLQFDVDQLKGMNPQIVARYSTKRRKVLLPTAGPAPYIALDSVENESVRRDIYVHGRQSLPAQIQTLETLMKTRAEIASLSEYKSYAHMNLTDKMAKSPEAVNSFLTALSADNAPHVMKEIEEMKALKVREGETCEIHPWDVMYYRNRINAMFQSSSRKPDFMAAYFSLGTVMQGLSRLFNRLYGIRFVPRETTPGEVWDEKVRRLDVFHETEGHVAVLYCDLFGRAGKTPNPTHFTLRCSRLISSTDPVEEENDGMAVSSPTGSKDRFQLPVIALVCDFPHPKNDTTPTLLGFQDVRTLFHEMGHAIHSILGRTPLQIVSGTRCPTDFAELPSVLMESFAVDPSVLALFARHWETDAPLPYELVENFLQTQRRGQGFQTETQILFSLLDQAYHSSLPLTMEGGFDSTKIFFDVYDKYGSVREPRDTSAQGFFGHLVEYGGTYYSYLFDRAIAGKLWREVFRAGKDGGGIDREAGERYKEEVLKWGGSRSGWACVSGVLKDDRLKDGGKEAMEEVGRWGVHD